MILLDLCLDVLVVIQSQKVAVERETEKTALLED